MIHSQGHRREPFLGAVAQRAKRPAARRSALDPRWILPGLALAAPLAAPLAGDASASVLQVCLMLGAIAGLWAIRSTGAFWSLLAWSGATGVFGVMLAFLDAPNGQSLALAATTVAAAQALALLGLASPATIAGWRARAPVLVCLCGPLALAILAINATPDWNGLAAAVAVTLDLAALPLALEARRRART